ncbi:MAG: tRNA epoxyqueuosine(34) reductase QueG [Bacteroidales bacterium]
MNKSDLTRLIKEKSLELGFSAVGVAKALPVDEDQARYFEKWIGKGYNGEMSYMSNNKDKRLDPTLLVEGARSIIVFALNYYPQKTQNEKFPQFSYYAYGKDYHDVIKLKLNSLYKIIESTGVSVSGRCFTDSAPVLERYWAVKAGLGFIGKSNMLILPKLGTFFFLGVMILDIDLEYDQPLTLGCGNCRKCLEACPTGALIDSYLLDARRCVSYLTIEYRGELPEELRDKFENRIYGCDTCQKVCPWNRFATPTIIREFFPSDEFLYLDSTRLNEMSEDQFRILFKGSPVKRTKYAGLIRNRNYISSSK